MEAMIGLFNTITPMSEGLENYLRSILRAKLVKRKEILLREGEVNRHIYYIEKGLVRGYYAGDGEEINAWFQKEGDIFISVHSFFQQRASHEFIQAVEDCVIWGISHEQLDYAYLHFPEFNFHARIILQKYYSLSEERNYILRRSTMSRRYEYYIEKYADLLLRVPDKYIATHLGMTITTYSHTKSKYLEEKRRKGGKK